MSNVAARRSTSNANVRGSAEGRRRRRRWLVQEFPADVHVVRVWKDGNSFDLKPRSVQSELEWVRQLELPANPFVPLAGCRYELLPAARCYRCGEPQTEDEVSPDRWPILGVDGGTYRRNNIRPSCESCNVATGSAVGHARKRAKHSRLAKQARPMLE